jgi:hypothetical protein
MTNVHTTYSKSLNVCVSSKSGVTIWTTGDSAALTIRMTAVVQGPTPSVRRSVVNTALSNKRAIAAAKEKAAATARKRARA